MFLRRVPLSVFVFVCCASAVSAQSVQRRARLGNNIEDITFISNGPLANSLVLANGYDLLVAPLAPAGGPLAPAPQRKLFDVRNTPIDNAPRGIAFIPREHALVFHSADDPTLYVVDEAGTYVGARPMTFPGSTPNYLEGMDYVPPSAPFYPNHLIVAANTFVDPTITPQIEVATLAGVVEAEIVVQPFPAGCIPVTTTDPAATPNCAFDPNNGILGLAYQDPGRMLMSLNDGTGTIWAIDFSGNVIGNGPVHTDTGTHGFEGLVQLSNGRVVASNYYTGQMLFFDRDMKRLSSEDRVYSVGIGVSSPFGLAWNSDDQRHVSFNRITQQLASISPTLDAASVFKLDLSSVSGNVLRRTAYVPDARSVVVLSRVPPQGPPNPKPPQTLINFFDAETGAAHSDLTLDISNAVNGNGAPLGIAFDHASNQFAVGVTNPQSGNAVLILARDGSYVRRFSVPVTPFQLALDPADPSGSRFVVSDEVTLAVVDSTTNAVLGAFNVRARLNLLVSRGVEAITSGPDTGALGIVDADDSELVVFKLPGE